MLFRAVCATLTLAAVLPAAADPLVTPQWLAEHRKDPGLVLLHVGADKDYAEAHIPGARLVKLSDISVPGERDILLELPPVPDLEKALRNLGISGSSRVVIYSGTAPVQSATRVWFTLDYLGAGDRAFLLDGGLAAWRSAGQPVAAEPAPPPATPGDFRAAARPEKVASAEWLREHLEDKSVAVVDARLPQFYRGDEPGMAARAGHIPGARSVPFASMLDEQGRFLPKDALRGKLPASGTLVPYCHIGQQATVIYFTARMLGREVRLYDGSFRDWAGREGYPVVKD